MTSKVFLDANIILDFTLKRPGFAEAKNVMGLAVNGQINAFVTSSIVQISGYWLAKAYGIQKAKELLLTLLIDVAIIDIPHEMVLSALHSKISDIEDALQYYTAIYHRMDYFISQDKKLIKESLPQLPVLSMTEFLKEFLP